MTQEEIDQLRRIKDEIADSFDEELEMQMEEDRLDELVAENMPGGLEDVLDRGAVDTLTGKGTVEVDDVQIFEALVLEALGLGGGIVVEDRGLVHVAQLQAHALTVLEVDGREKDHGVHPKKFSISLRPRAWLFSGWNCVPKILSRPTQAVTVPP